MPRGFVSPQWSPGKFILPVRGEQERLARQLSNAQAMNQPTASKRHDDRLLLVGLAFLNLIFYWSLLDYFRMNLEDEGDLLYPALRILWGERPYADFHSGLAPGSLYLLAFWMKIFGVSLQSARCFTLAMAIVSQILLYLTARRFCPRAVSIGATLALMLTSLYNWPVASYHWVAMTCVLLTIYGNIRMLADPQRPLFPFLAGAAASLSAFVLQTAGITAIGLCLVTAAIVGWVHGARVGLRLLGKGVAGALILGLPALIALMSWSGTEPVLNNLIYNHLASSNEGRLGLQNTSLIIFPWEFTSTAWSAIAATPWAGIWAQRTAFLGAITWPILYLLTVGLFYPLTILFLGLSGVQFFRAPSSFPKQSLFCLSLAAAIASLTALYRPDFAHICFVRHCWWIPCAFYLYQWTRHPSRPVALLGRSVVAVCLGLILVQAYVQCSNTLQGNEVRLKLPNGVIRTSNHPAARNIQLLDQFLQAKGARRPPLFVYPISPLLYFLLNADNVTAYDRMIPVWSSAEEFRDALESLGKQPPEAIVLLDFDYQAYFAEYPAMDPELFVRQDREFRQRLLEQNCDVISIWPQFQILKQRTSR